jgi:hypothetical protein
MAVRRGVATGASRGCPIRIPTLRVIAALSSLTQCSNSTRPSGVMFSRRPRAAKNLYSDRNASLMRRGETTLASVASSSVNGQRAPINLYRRPSSSMTSAGLTLASSRSMVVTRRPRLKGKTSIQYGEFDPVRHLHDDVAVWKRRHAPE